MIEAVAGGRWCLTDPAHPGRYVVIRKLPDCEELVCELRSWCEGSLWSKFGGSPLAAFAIAQEMIETYDLTHA